MFENKKQLYIVMELCSGGDLYRGLPYSERGAAHITAQLCSAIAYMHVKGVVHRDCKYKIKFRSFFAKTVYPHFISCSEI